MRIDILMFFFCVANTFCKIHYRRSEASSLQIEDANESAWESIKRKLSAIAGGILWKPRLNVLTWSSSSSFVQIYQELSQRNSFLPLTIFFSSEMQTLLGAYPCNGTLPSELWRNFLIFSRALNVKTPTFRKIAPSLCTDHGDQDERAPNGKSLL